MDFIANLKSTTFNYGHSYICEYSTSIHTYIHTRTVRKYIHIIYSYSLLSSTFLTRLTSPNEPRPDNINPIKMLKLEICI